MVEVGTPQYGLKKRLKIKYLDFAKEHHFFMVMLNKYRYKKGKKLYKEVINLPIDEKMVIFDSFMGRQYSCSPKAIYLEMLNDERFKDWTFVWTFKKPMKFAYLGNHKNTIVVKYNSPECRKYYSKAKYWITNSRLRDWLEKKDGQVYIQCWHGTPLKRLAHDIAVGGDNALNSKDDLLKKYDDDSARYSYMVSPSQFSTDKFSSAFKVDKEIIKTLGYPRNDFLLNYKKEDIEAIKKSLLVHMIMREHKNIDIHAVDKAFSFDFNKKFILYAPTWRDNQHTSGVGYTYDIAVDFERLKKEFGDEYIILFRAHYFIANRIDLTPWEGFVIDVSTYGDINELYVLSDILITDYSSVFFDYSNLQRPIIFYMYDFDEYKNEMRDFYIDIEELPGPIVKTEDDLIASIKDIENYSAEYSEKYKAFNDKYTYLDDGKASQRVIEQLILNNQ